MTTQIQTAEDVQALSWKGKLETMLRDKKTIGRIMLAMGRDPKNPDDKEGLSRAMECCSSVLAEVQKSMLDKYKTLDGTEPETIINAMVDAAKFGLTIDGRQHAHLIKRDKFVYFQIGYRGFLSKIQEHHPDASIIVRPVFVGDDLHISEIDGVGSYTLKPADPFCSDPEKLLGVLVSIEYTTKGNNPRLVRDLTLVNKQEIEKARAASSYEKAKVSGYVKGNTVWDTWYLEKAKVAAIKKAAKFQFASLQGLQDLIRYDNETNFSFREQQDHGEEKLTAIDGMKSKIAQTFGAQAPHPVIEAPQMPVDAVALVEAVREPDPLEEALGAPTMGKDRCPSCNGAGAVPWTDGAESGMEPCTTCKGRGY